MGPPNVRVARMSPELALVDPQLAAGARRNLPDAGEALAPGRQDLRAAADEHAAALRRISRVSELDELDRFPEFVPRLRIPKFAVAMTTWGTALFLLADERIYDWSTWPL
jgi:hypothetical protein